MAEERIAKIIASAGYCSRRQAEELILKGKVKVNGIILDTPCFKAKDSDTILIDDKPLKAKEQGALWLYHKPQGLITTHNDPLNRPTVFEALPKNLGFLRSIGRLDLNTEGLLLLTNDPGIAHQLETSQLKRTYHIRVFGIIPKNFASILKKGITIEGVFYSPIESQILKQTDNNSWISLTLTEGKNREIRNILNYFNLKINKLIRVSYGPFELGDLKKGDLKKVSPKKLAEVLCGL